MSTLSHSRRPQTTTNTNKRQGVKSSRYQLDYNVYATKKNIAQGMIDIALLTANATQLKYLLDAGAPSLRGQGSTSFGGRRASVGSGSGLITGADIGSALGSTTDGDRNYWSYYFYWASIGSIGLSVVLQLIIGILLLLNARHDVVKRSDRLRAECCNNSILTGIFFITIINIFIGVFIQYD